MNPAYINEATLDVDEVDPPDLAPLVSGNASIVTAPASEDEDVAEDVVEDRDDNEGMEDVPQILRDVVSDLEELNKELRSILSPAPGDTSSHQSADVPQVEVWDTGKTWELEHRLHPDPSIDEISSRLFNQVWDLLKIL